MKKLFASLLAVGLLLARLPALAQTPVAPKIYPLTNGNTFSLAGGYTNMANGALTLINSQPFPVWRGRGFTVNTSVVATNAATLTCPMYFQFASPYYSNGVLVTNWSSAYTVGGTPTLNGTTKVFYWNLVPPTTVDNVTYGRLAAVSNGHSAYVSLDPTNTYVSVVP